MAPVHGDRGPGQGWAGKAGLTRTIRDDPQASGRIARAAAGASLEPVVAPPDLVGASLVALLRARGHELGEAGEGDDGKRYLPGPLLGSGSTSRVHAFLDRDLAREVAVKVLVDGEGVPQFVHEARITASLQHPNVPPVYDLGMNGADRLYFVMKKIDGRSLGSLLDARAGSRPAPPVNDAVTIFRSVAHALSFAHHHGIIHQDVKPDNIMLGDFGEVLLGDWGSASRSGSGGRLYGTPLYMSPEQARREPADARSDIYCLGASLFHVLLRRPPMMADDVDAFWSRKRVGRIDEPSAEERQAVPAVLLDIALKALQPLPADRYQTVDEMIADLGAFQAGLAVSAHRDSWWELVRRWHRRHARLLWPGLAAMAIIAALTLSLYGERLKEIATWGSPLIRLDAARWTTEWQVLEGGFETRDGWLVTTGALSNLLAHPRRLDGDTAIEYQAEMLPGSRPCDLSIFWAPDAELDTAGRVLDLHEPYQIQIGAYDGAYTAIIKHRAGFSQHLAYDDFHPLPGVRYRIRIEIIGNRMTIAIDGRRVCEYVDEFPLTGGHVALYGYYPGKAFSDLRVYALGLPQRVAPTAIGDEFLRQGDVERAAGIYGRIERSHPGSALAEEARYKQGVCAYRSGRFAEAEALWAPLVASEWSEQARLYRLERLFAERRHDEALAEMQDLYQNARAEDTRHRVTLAWAAQSTRVAARSDEHRALLERYLELHDRLFPRAGTTDRAAAEVLLDLGRYEELLARYPRQRWLGCRALGLLNRHLEIPQRFPGQRAAHRDAYLRIARFDLLDDGMLADCAPEIALIQGRLEEVVGRWPDSDEAARALLALGRLGEVVERHPRFAERAQILEGRVAGLPEHRRVSLDALMAAGRAVDAERWHREGDASMWPRHLLGLQAFIAGDPAAAREWFAMRPEWEFDQREFVLAHYAIAPFLRQLAGEDGAVERAARDTAERVRWPYQQEPWHVARYLLGELDDQGFLAQPSQLHIHARLAVVRGIRAELGGDRSLAAQAWQDYLRMPAYERDDVVDPVVDGFVAWRAAELAR